MKTGFTNYRLRSLLILTAFSALFTIAAPSLEDWFSNPPSVPLRGVVAASNESKASQNPEKDITEEEIVTAINRQLPTLVEAERVKNILRRIVDKQRVPTGTTISFSPVLSASSQAKNYWATNLNFPAPKSGYSRYSIRIRESPYEE